MIEIKDLVKQYRKTDFKALNHINLKIEKGMFGLLGSNGAGKSTLMNILSTQLKMSSGKVLIEDINLEEKNYSKIRSIIGYMPQEIGMYPDLSVYEILDFFGIINEVNGVLRKERIENLLCYVNLDEHRNKKFKNLSGGMKRRVGLAVALINDPTIIIADEPTTGIDPNERIRMRNLLMDLSEEKTVLLSTHIIEDISYTCKKLAILTEGSVSFQGELSSLISLVQNKIWSYTAASYEEVKEISKRYVVLGVNIEGDSRNIKLLSETKPYSSAIVEKPTLEDAFIAIERKMIK